METEPIRLSINEALVYAALINAAIGFVLGLIPLGFGYLNGRKTLGVFGIIGSTLGGAALGIYFSFPIVAIFMWLIIENRLARVGISTFVTVVGLSLAVLAYLRHASGGSTQMLESLGSQDPIFLALMIGGIVFTLVGGVLLILSILSKSRTNDEESSAAPVVVGNDDERLS